MGPIWLMVALNAVVRITHIGNTIRYWYILGLKITNNKQCNGILSIIIIIHVIHTFSYY